MDSTLDLSHKEHSKCPVSLTLVKIKNGQKISLVSKRLKLFFMHRNKFKGETWNLIYILKFGFQSSGVLKRAAAV